MVERDPHASRGIEPDTLVPQNGSGVASARVRVALTAEEAEEAEFQRQMEVGRRVQRDFAKVLAALAK